MRFFGRRLTVTKIKRKITSIAGRGVEYRATPRRDVLYATNPRIQQIVFICGLHRSGTTLLERLLTTRYEMAYLRAYVPASEGQHMQTVFKAESMYGGPGRFAYSQKMIEDLRAMTDYVAYKEKILSEWRQFVVTEHTTLLEKSPSHMCRMWWLRQVFPGCRFIIMTRDPRAVSSATQKWSKTSLTDLMMHWNIAYSIAMDDFSKEDCTLVRYEDVIERTDEEIERIADFIGCKPRTEVTKMETRHAALQNSNDKYLELHKVARYGKGIWTDFGYEI